MADTNNLLPVDVIYYEILTRLPVKSLLRFKSVSKTWESVISSSNFIKSHLIRAESDPQNDYLFLHSGYHGCADLDDKLSIVSPDGIYESHRVEDDYKLYEFGHIPLDIVGSVNGLICVGQGCCVDDVNVFHIWNPATKRVVSIQHHTLDRQQKMIWSGMGYDPLQNDYKIICIVNTEEGKGPLYGDIYSINAGCWRQEVHLMNVDFPFCRGQEYVVNVNGCPYWIDRIMYVGFSEVYDIKENEQGLLIGIMFDIQIGEFRLLPQLPLLKEWGGLWSDVVNWNDSLTAMIFRYQSCQIDFYTLSYEKSSVSGSGGAFWSGLYTINFLPDRPLQCFRNGDILFCDTKSEWSSYDCEYDVIKSLGKCYGYYFNSFSYIQSLVFLKGMEPCTRVEFLTNKRRGNEKSR